MPAILWQEIIKATIMQNQSQLERKKEQSQQKKDLTMAVQLPDITVPVAP